MDMSLKTRTGKGQRAARRAAPPVPAPDAARSPAPAAPAEPATTPPVQQDALGRRLARAVLQRKSLAQLNWLPALSPAGKAKLVSDGRPVSVYTETEPAEPDKLAALKQAAASNAYVGGTVDYESYEAWSEQYGWAGKPKWRNDKWTRGPVENFEQEGFNSVDPFFYEVTVPYKFKDAPRTLKLRFQHSSAYTGYVETVYDSGNAEASKSPSMYDFSTEAPLKGAKPEGVTRNMRYSNKHDTRSRDEIFDQTYGGSEESLDAYTKIAGEGARWECVRNHADRLRNDSYFYVADSDDSGRKKFWGVTFVSLWLSWDSVFNKRYGIEDGDVARAIRSGDFGRDCVEVWNPKRKDYDVEGS